MSSHIDDVVRARHDVDVTVLIDETRIAGSVKYMAPEQIDGELLDPRTDLYAIQRRYVHTNATLRFAARQGYDTYLKANRVERGVESYDAVIQLILGTAFDEAGNPRVR